MREQLIQRGARLHGFSMHTPSQIVSRALDLLSSMTLSGDKSLDIEPRIHDRADYKNMLVLGHYRNKLAHYFFLEAVWAVAFHAHTYGALSQQQQQLSSSVSPQSSSSAPSVPLAAVQQSVAFLLKLLQREFIYKSMPEEPEDMRAVLDTLCSRGVFRLDGDMLIMQPSGDALFSFLCHLLWPYVDSYFSAAMSLLLLKPGQSRDESAMLKESLWLAVTLYHERLMSFYESSSLDTLKTAFFSLSKFDIITMSSSASSTDDDPSPSKVFIALRAPYDVSCSLLDRFSHLSLILRTNLNSNPSSKRSEIFDDSHKNRCAPNLVCDAVCSLNFLYYHAFDSPSPSLFANAHTNTSI